MNTTTPIDNKSDGHKSPEKLENEVDQVRARLGRTVDELSDRLSPGELLDQALHMAREHGGEFGRNLANQVKYNPMPLLLTGVGLSWLMVSSKEPSRYNYSGRVANDGDYTRYELDDLDDYDMDDDYYGESEESGVKKALDDTVERTRRAKEAVKQNVHDVSDNVRAKVRSGGETATQLFEEHPLICGSLGVAVGAALGAMIPPSETEDKLMGTMSDEAAEKATSVAREEYEKARDTGKKVVEKTKQEATQDPNRSAC